MAHPNLALIGALRQAANNLKNGAYYAWGHHGSCNCGHLLQVITNLSKEEILRNAHTGMGEWTEIAESVCEVTSLPADQMIARLQSIGLTPTDIHHLEYLQDREVLEALPGGFRWLKRNIREDVIAYFETLASVLEEKLLASIELPEIPCSLYSIKALPVVGLQESVLRTQ
ncbi:MAG TPA: hypothetical protein VLC28_03170 [Flavitalea sp.]|nr:hypothetical protein [Flavitalea sp.]